MSTGQAIGYVRTPNTGPSSQMPREKHVPLRLQPMRPRRTPTHSPAAPEPRLKLRWPTAACRCTALLLTLATVGCKTTLSADQRQQLETHIHHGPYDPVFYAARNTAMNAGFSINNYDHQSGFFGISKELDSSKFS